jgi:hypothetical protein
MVASHLVWLLRTKEMRKRATESGHTFDEDEECVQWQARGINLGTMFLKVIAKKNRSRDCASSADALVVPQHVVPKTVPNAMV